MPAVPLKLKNSPLRDSRSMFQNEMPIKQDGLNLREHAVVAIQVCPARLHHADFRLREVVNHSHQPVGRRNKVSIEDGNEPAFRSLQARVERTRLESVAVSAVDVLNGVA